MHSHKKLLLSFSIAGLFVFGFLVPTVVASAYEWITFFSTPPSMSAGTSVTVSWQIGTSGGSWVENRTVYYGTSTHDNILPTQWFEAYNQSTSTPCRVTGAVNGFSAVESCTINLWRGVEGMVAANDKFWLRVTTNYNGCGSYTPTPSDSCGDSMSATVPFSN